MGTLRTEAFLQCQGEMDLEISDHSLMMVICHKWNDHQVRPFDIRFDDLLSHMAYAKKNHPHRTLLRSLARLVERGYIQVIDNDKRYHKDLKLEIQIVAYSFVNALSEQMAKYKERRNGTATVESRDMKSRQNGTRHEVATTRHEVASWEVSRHEVASSRHEVASHSSTKDSKDLTPKKDPIKAAGPLVTENNHSGNGVAEEQDLFDAVPIAKPSTNGHNGNGRAPSRRRAGPPTIKDYRTGKELPAPQLIFMGVAPTQLDYATATMLNDVHAAGSPQEKEWARSMFQHLRSGGEALHA